MYRNIYLRVVTLIFTVGLTGSLQAQFYVSGQVRTRTEYRDGQGTPSVSDTVPAIFTSQRTRLNFAYAAHRLKLQASVQDVRVWGQDASSLNRVTADAFNGFMVHEAWAEISLVDTGKVVKNFSLRIGRQELVYDDSRLLGNLDWLQQARRHDAALLRFDHNGWVANAGFAFNQNAERKSNHAYNGVPTGYAAGTNGIGALYKTMQFLYISRKIKFGNASLLVFRDAFSKYRFAETDIEQTNPILDKGTWGRYTIGGHLSGTAFAKVAFTASAYYQGGKYRDGTALDEYLISVSTLYSLGKKFSLGPGIDVTSGNNGTDPAKKYQRFDPLYGTPHKFWGYMDYFYVADGFGSNGLINYYVRSRFKPSENLTVSLDVHRFVLPSAVMNEAGIALNKSLGTEFDLVANFTMTKAISIEGGYSAMLSTSTLASTPVKNVLNADEFSSWAYLMISIKPEFVFK